MADTQLSSKQRVGFAAAPLALVAALVAALGTNDSAHEGRRYTAYYDSAGILTVCAGITGPAVVKGKRYTDDECTRLETAYVRTMLGHMGQGVWVVSMTQREGDGIWIAFLDRHRHGPGGPSRVCSSFENGKAGAERWVARHEARLREDVAKITAWRVAVRANRLAKANTDPPFGWMG